MARQAGAQSEVAESEMLWRQYQLHVDLYKFYLELIIKVVAFYYAVTGAILSFFFTRTDVPSARWALVFPICLSMALAGISIYGSSLMSVTRNDVFRLRNRLSLETAPEMRVLQVLLIVVALLALVTGAAMLLVIVYV